MRKKENGRFMRPDCLVAGPLLVAFFCTVLGAQCSAQAVEEAKAAAGPAFNIAVFVSTRIDCYESGNVAAIKRLTSEEQTRINRRGGIAGRPIKVTVYDDQRDEKKSIENVRAALLDPRTIAMVGLSGSTRPKAVFEAVGADIERSSIPFISDISDNKIFANAPNVYTTRASQDDDRVPLMVSFPRQIGYQRPAFVGLKDNPGSASMGEALKAELGASGGLLADYRIGVVDEKIVKDEVSAMVADLKGKNADLVYVSVGGANAGVVISQLVSGGVTPALFLGGNIETVSEDAVKSYPNAIYSLAWDHPPEVDNNRIRKHIGHQNASNWVFEGAKIPTAPGWAKGECQERPLVEFPDPFKPQNLRAITTGSQFADMVALVAGSARTGEKTTDINRLRARVLQELSSTYAAGRSYFKGSFDNWSFVPKTRSAARSPFVIILPQNLGRMQLAPIQFVRAKDGKLKQIETLYADIDLIKAHRVDENEKSFHAEFYLSLYNSKMASIDRIEFANAYLETKSSGGRQITVETLHPGGESRAFPDSMKIFKVSGRFLFDPKLKNYPFDTQRFAIELQPKDVEQPFIVQPPPLELRDKLVTSDGWDANAQYVGYEEDFVPIIDAYTHAPSAAPFYKSSFAWEMKRQTTDYLLRVAVPLGFILFVAYLSIFISRAHFEAIVTIQVTALLSSVALYLSLAKLDSDIATLSDRAFVFAYMILSLMIAISIFRINPLLGNRRGPDRALEFAHIALIPLFVAVAVYYGYQVGQAG